MTPDLTPRWTADEWPCICAYDACDEWDEDYPEGCKHCAALDPEYPCPHDPESMECES